ncbi:MAG: PKD domain-containing protein [Actinobacteria bacterium]|nr:PKD domain-containing protein [Actinomycetota bacterium]
MLATPATWRKNKIPQSKVRRPLKLLGAAERVLLRSASRKCARSAADHRLKSHKGGSGAAVVQPPDQNPDQGEDEEEPIPQGKLRRPKGLGDASGAGADRYTGTAASSMAYASKRSSVSTAASRNLARIAVDPFNIFRNADVGVPPRQASPQEPTTAIAPSSGVAWYTGNSSVALSTDNGRSWNMFNPSNVLPDQGLAFCCDQLVSYSPTYNLFVWVSQYWCDRSCLISNGATPPRMVCRPQSDAVYNRVRIAVARPEDLRTNASNPGAAWTYWDVTPGTVGQPRSTWFDRSDLAVNATSINWNVDSVCGSSGSVLGRISLAQLAARGTVTLQYMNENARMSSTQGVASATTYYSGANTMGQARIWSWAPSSGTLFRHDINHSTVPVYDNAINGTDSSNWYDRYGIFPGEVESSTLSGNTLYLAQGTGRAYCTARCDTATPTLSHFLDQPAVFISKFDVNTWRLAGERWIWNPTIAMTWPALQTDGVGDVGLAMRSSTNNHNARPVAGFLTPDEQFSFTNPEGSPHEAGDYYSLRPGRTSRSFVMPGQTVQNDSGVSNMHWLFIEYGLGAAPYVAPPTVHITAPATLTRYAQGATAHYTADVSDPIDGTLPAAAIRWTEDGSAIGTGASLNHVESSPGTHTITVTATNGDGRSVSDSITIRVNSSLSSISAAISTPVDNAWLGYSTYNPTYGEYCQDVDFGATASGGSGPLSYSWTDSQDGGAPKTVSSALSPTLTLCAGTAPNHTATHDLTLTVTDGKDTTEVFVRVFVLSWKLA